MIPYSPWIALAAKRARVWLADGSCGVLVGVPRRSGPRVRVEFDGGRRRTYLMADVIGTEEA